MLKTGILTSDEATKLKDMMIHDEDHRNFVYVDTKGNETVGIGHLMRNGLPDNVIDLLYETDMNNVLAFLYSNYPWYKNLDSARKLALANMCFNLGCAKFAQFHNMLAAFAMGDYEAAAIEAIKSDWAKELPNRADRIAKIIKTGTMP